MLLLLLLGACWAAWRREELRETAATTAGKMALAAEAWRLAREDASDARWAASERAYAAWLYMAGTLAPTWHRAREEARALANEWAEHGGIGGGGGGEEGEGHSGDGDGDGGTVAAGHARGGRVAARDEEEAEESEEVVVFPSAATRVVAINARGVMADEGKIDEVHEIVAADGEDEAGQLC